MPLTAPPAFQEEYPDALAHCYGCGRLNQHGYQIKSYWEENGAYSVCHFQPKPYHTAVPGYVYGGLLASLVDCHATGTASAAARLAQLADGSVEGTPRFLTASLNVDFLKPTPLGPTLELRGWVSEIKGRKVVVEVHIFADSIQTVRGKVICVQATPELLMELGIHI
jgi:acyl-coenzyme A thioesterase PaaI-like protein